MPKLSTAILNRNAQLAEALGRALLRRGWQVTAAESCTGGGICHAFTAVPGSSRWFEGGFVTYSNRLKTRVLGVDAGLIDAHGAVSEAVALAMLQGALAMAAAQCGVAVSGIAGPDGGTADKPVGTVVLAWGTATQARAETLRFAGDRDAVREQSITTALERLLRFLESTV